MRNKLFGKGLLEKPGNCREVFALIIVGGMKVYLSLPDFVDGVPLFRVLSLRTEEKVVTIKV